MTMSATQSNGSERTGTEDAQFNLISALYHALEGATTYATYAADAERAGDRELAAFFAETVRQTRTSAERATVLLAQRLQAGGSSAN